MVSISCPNCSEDIKEPSIFCPHCDKIFPESMQKALYEKPKKKVFSKDAAIKAANTGAITACVIGVYTIGFLTYEMLNNADGIFWNSIYFYNIIFDLILVFILAYGIYKKSRAAAVSMFAYWIFAKVYIYFQTGKLQLIIGLIILYIFGKAIQGTYTYHKIEKETNPEYKPTPRWTYVLGIFAGLFLLLSMSIVVMEQTGIMLPNKVVSGDKVKNSDRELLKNNKIINDNEKIEYFGFDGIASILESGNILTDKRVIVYSTNEKGKLDIYGLYFGDIASVQLVEDGNIFEDSVYQVNGINNEVWLRLYLSTESGGDKKFVKALRNKMG